MTALKALSEYRAPQTEAVTEDSAALDFKDRHKGKLLFDHDAGAWFNWTGSHWRREKTGLAFDWARDLARDLANDQSAKNRATLRKVSFASGVEKFCQRDRAFAVTSHLFNRDPMLLGTPGGTIDVRPATFKLLRRTIASRR